MSSSPSSCGCGCSCSAGTAKASFVGLHRENFRKMVDGKQVDLFTIKNTKGMVVRLTNYGAKILQILVPDRNGVIGDVVQGYDTLEGAMGGQGSMGSFIGRYAGRIEGGVFSFEGKEYKLARNAGENFLHGGQKGSRFCVFDAKHLDSSRLEMTYTFKDGEEGFPGTVPLRVVYTVTDDNALSIDFTAVAADKNTLVNFTEHSFFNLSGKGDSEILDHLVTVNADQFLVVNEKSIATGEIRSVEGTPLDFRMPALFGARIGQAFDQLKHGGGYDQHFVLNKRFPGELSFCAKAEDPKSGRVLEVWSTEPGMQLYSGNFLEGKKPRDVGKGGALYVLRSGFCMEPSHFPNSPNRPNFPSTVLKAGEWKTGKIIYKFGVAE